MADLTKFRQTDLGQIGDVYANYDNRDTPDMLANFVKLTLDKLAMFMQIMTTEIPLTYW